MSQGMPAAEAISFTICTGEGHVGLGQGVIIACHIKGYKVSKPLVQKFSKILSNGDFNGEILGQSDDEKELINYS